ncbi:MAG: spore germination protein GerW family protein [bacterium]|nr:spore germination protein GerW family protein [bacterium]
MNLSETIKEILGQMKEIAATNTVVGEPVKMGEKVIIPITQVSLGFGVGGHETKKESDSFMGGSGGGISIQPVGFIVSDSEKTQLLLVNEKGTQFGKVLDILPGIIEKVASNIKVTKGSDEKPKTNK